MRILKFPMSEPKAAPIKVRLWFMVRLCRHAHHRHHVASQPKVAHLVKSPFVPRERLTYGPAGEVAAFQAHCWREGDGVQLRQAGGVSGHGDRRPFGDGDAVALRSCVVPLRGLRNDRHPPRGEILLSANVFQPPQTCLSQSCPHAEGAGRQLLRHVSALEDMT